MLTFASFGDLHDLKKIWKTCFGDEDAYINMFFTYRFIPSQTLVYKENGSAVSMVFMLPAHIQLNRSVKPAHYIYAAATLPAYQGRGLMRMLLGRALEVAALRGQAYSILVPGEKSLYDYYNHLGYRTAFYIKTLQLRNEEIFKGTPLPLIPADAKLMALAARRYLSRHAYAVVWDSPAMQYIRIETAYFGGRILGFEGPGGPGYAVVLPQGKKVYVKEIMCDDADIPDAISTLAYHFPAAQYEIRLKEDIRFQKGVISTRAFGMIRPVGATPAPDTIEHGYLNLVLD